MKILGFLIALAVGLGLLFLGSALAISCANSWIMQDTFANGWSASVDRWYITLGFGLLFGGLSVNRN